MANLPASPIEAPADGGDSSNPQLQSGVSAASTMPCVGANTAGGEPAVQAWSQETRNPVPSGPIGNGIDSNPRYTAPVTLAATNLLTVNYTTIADFNDTLIFAEADTTVASPVAGNVFDSVTGAVVAVGWTGGAIAIGDWLWGEVPVA
tara:strand:- start:13386 stop:13829 length:444 start_codon:yes stop_codon:yes gene_type:complete